MVKKLKHLKTLKTFVEYQAHLECGCDSIFFKMLCGMLKIIHIPNGVQSNTLCMLLYCVCVMYAGSGPR